MSICTKLLNLVEGELIPEVEDFIDKIFELVNDKKATDEDKEALEEARELLKSFKELVEDIYNNEVDKEECQETYDGLMAMDKE
ncbi:MAG: hypothetical protein OIF32_11360 [Campylobacterales bacterium]|nr:hypothetical protein [Campylobacterales bacterium]